jgi:hypothetical protein
MLWFQDQKCPGWSRTMIPDVYRHLAPTLGQKWVFLIRPTIAYRIRSPNTIRMTIHSCCVASFHHRYTAGNDFPHSRQNSFERDVINPQDGHILCDLKPAICGFSLLQRANALKFLNGRVPKVGSVRKRGQNGRKTGSMVNPHFYRLRRGPSRKA